MAEFDFGVAYHQSLDERISFYSNTAAGPDAYDVVIGRDPKRGKESRPDHFYIPDRCLDGLISNTTEEMISRLDHVSGYMLGDILKKHKISHEQFHIALLHVKLKMQTEELEFSYRNYVVG